jgi:hypothetical protein
MKNRQIKISSNEPLNMQKNRQIDILQFDVPKFVYRQFDVTPSPLLDYDRANGCMALLAELVDADDGVHQEEDGQDEVGEEREDGAEAEVRPGTDFAKLYFGRKLSDKFLSLFDKISTLK